MFTHRAVHAVYTMLGCLTLSACLTQAEADEVPVTTQLVDTLTTLSGGPHAGMRSNHAKGVMVSGTFTPTPEAAGLSSAPHFHTTTPVLVRYSNATGVPNIPDAQGNAFPKGMAIRFQLAQGAATDLVAISVNGFPAATPEEFLGLLNAVRDSQQSSAMPTPITHFLATHPAARTFVSTPKPAPESFATQPFYGVNAFAFSNAAGQTVYGRYQILPLAGARYLSQTSAEQAAADYLMTDIVSRVQQGGVQYQLVLQIAEADDVTDNPTVVWPAQRQIVVLGTLTLNQAVADSRSAEKNILFNPLQLTQGIAPSQDPILLARPAVYAVSFGRRQTPSK